MFTDAERSPGRPDDVGRGRYRKSPIRSNFALLRTRPRMKVLEAVLKRISGFVRRDAYPSSRRNDTGPGIVKKHWAGYAG
jgi:hypothetical protein